MATVSMIINDLCLKVFNFSQKKFRFGQNLPKNGSEGQFRGSITRNYSIIDNFQFMFIKCPYMKNIQRQ